MCAVALKASDTSNSDIGALTSLLFASVDALWLKLNDNSFSWSAAVAWFVSSLWCTTVAFWSVNSKCWYCNISCGVNTIAGGCYYSLNCSVLALARFEELWCDTLRLELDLLGIWWNTAVAWFVSHCRCVSAVAVRWLGVKLWSNDLGGWVCAVAIFSDNCEVWDSWVACAVLLNSG